MRDICPEYFTHGSKVTKIWRLLVQDKEPNCLMHPPPPNTCIPSRSVSPSCSALCRLPPALFQKASFKLSIQKSFLITQNRKRSPSSALICRSPLVTELVISEGIRVKMVHECNPKTLVALCNKGLFSWHRLHCLLPPRGRPPETCGMWPRGLEKGEVEAALQFSGSYLPWSGSDTFT